MNRWYVVATACLGCCARPALAGVVYEANPAAIGSAYREGFQGMPSGGMASYQLPSGMGTLVSNNGQPNLLNTGGWGWEDRTIYAYEGSHFQGDAGCLGYTFNFATPTDAFGAYFGSLAVVAGGTAEIFDQTGASMGVFPIQGPSTTWKWDGWRGTDGTLFSKVKITPSNPFGGFLMVDAAATGLVPAPCAAATLALGLVMASRRRR